MKHGRYLFIIVIILLSSLACTDTPDEVVPTEWATPASSPMATVEASESAIQSRQYV